MRVQVAVAAASSRQPPNPIACGLHSGHPPAVPSGTGACRSAQHGTACTLHSINDNNFSTVCSVRLPGELLLYAPNLTRRHPARVTTSSKVRLSVGASPAVKTASEVAPDTEPPFVAASAPDFQNCALRVIFSAILITFSRFCSVTHCTN